MNFNLKFNNKVKNTITCKGGIIMRDREWMTVLTRWKPPAPGRRGVEKAADMEIIE